MRLFVAVELDDAVRRAADAAADALRRAIGSSLQARWVTPANMHLTVRFIGQVDEARGPAILEALSPPLATAAFDVELGACGAFPSSGAPRVIWIGLAAGLPALAELHAEFDRRLAPFGFAPETRPFTAHLTLARMRSDAPRRAGESKGASGVVQRAIRGVKPAPARCHVTRATVFQSHLSSRGPRYEPLAFARLTDAK
jgi:2'-5' RNA ligase